MPSPVICPFDFLISPLARWPKITAGMPKIAVKQQSNPVTPRIPSTIDVIANPEVFGGWNGLHRRRLLVGMLW